MEDSQDQDARATSYQKAKSTMMQMYYEIMKHRYIPRWLGFLLVLVMGMQLIGAMTTRNFEFAETGTILETLLDICSYLRIYPVLDKYDKGELYWFIQYAFFALTIVYMLLLLYVYVSIRINKFFVDFPLKILSVMSMLFFWVLFTPVAETVFSVYACTDGFHITDTSLKCWSGAHIFYCIFFTTGFVLFFGISLLIAAFFNESQPNVADSLRRFDTSLEIHLCLYRGFTGALLVHFARTSYDWMILAVYCLDSLNFLRLYFDSLPFYDGVVSVTYGSCVWCYFWASANFLLGKVVDYSEFTGKMALAGIALAVPLVYAVRDRLISQLMFEVRHNKIDNEAKFDLFVRKIVELVNSKEDDKASKMCLLGLVVNHKSECADPACPLTKSEIYCPLTDTLLAMSRDSLENPILVLDLLKSTFIKYVTASNFQAALHISFSHYLFTYIGNVHMAITELHVAENMSLSFQQQFTLYRNKRLIENFLITKYNKGTLEGVEKRSFKNLDVTVVLKFEELYNELLRLIEKSASAHMEFWMQLDAVMPNLNALHKFGLAVTKHNAHIAEVWTLLAKINPNHHKALRDYGQYLKIVRNDEVTGEECIERGKSIEFSENFREHHNDFSLMFAEDTAIIIMGAGNKETQGKVLNTNSGIFNLFKYKPAEIIGQDIGILMPRLIASRHSQFLESYSLSGRERLVNNERELYALRRGGSLICISIIVKLVPTLRSTVEYIGVVREQHKSDMFVLTDTAGRVDAMSEALIGTLETTHKFLKENEVYAQFVFPELLALKVGQDGNFSTPWESVNENGNSYYGDLQFIVPRNLWTHVAEYNKNVNVKGLEKALDSDGEREVEVADSFSDAGVIRKKALPKSIKQIAHLIYGSKYKSHAMISSNILFTAINYDDYEKKETFTVEIKEENYGGGKLLLKVIRIQKKEARDDDMQDSMQNLKHLISRNRLGYKTSSRPRKLSLGSSRNQERKSQQVSAKEVGKKPKMPPMAKSQSSAALVKTLNTLGSKANKEFKSKLTLYENREETKEFLNAMNLNKGKRGELGDSKNVSMAIDTSNMEQTPLIFGDSFVAPKSERHEVYLQKHQEDLQEQELLIQSFVVARESQNEPGKVPSAESAEEGEGKSEEKKEEKEKAKFAQDDDSGSVASKTKSVMKHIKALKNAVYEDYCPDSINQLKRVANIIFVILFAIALIYYIISLQLYNNIETVTTTIHSARQRILCVTAMGTCTRTLVLMNGANFENGPMIQLGQEDDYYLDGFEGFEITHTHSLTYQQWAYYCLERGAREAKAAQNELSTKASKFSKANLERINPSQIVISYKEEEEMIGNFTLDCWGAIMGLVIHALEVKDMPLAEISPDNPKVYYVLQNAFNSILSAVYNANDAIESDADSSTRNNKIILMVLMLLAAVSTLASTAFILRVTIMVNNSKEDILKLFTSIPSADVKLQIGRCRTIFQDSDKYEYKDQNPEGELEESKENETEEEKEKDGDEDANLVDEDVPKKAKKSRKSKKKKYKPYTSNSLLLVVGFTVFAALFEAYFIGMFVKSLRFFAASSNVSQAVLRTSDRTLNSGLMYKTYQEYVGSSGKSTIEGVNSEDYLVMKLNQFISNQLVFLEKHAQQSNSYTSEYNEAFEALVFSDACKEMYSGEEREQCNVYSILNKGLHPATVYFWDFVRDFTDKHILQKDTYGEEELMYIFLNNEIYWHYQRMEYRYFNKIYERLLTILRADLRHKFDTESKIIMVFFICFAVALAIIYLFVWRVFVESTRNSLWVTKCMLGILSSDIILNVQPIKEFLINSSKGFILNSDSN